MNAEGVQLQNILESFCTGLDDFMQLAGDAGDEDIADDFNKSYSKIELYLIQVRNKKELTDYDRNDIRLEMKHCVKQAGFYC